MWATLRFRAGTRLAKLAGGVAVLKVGAATETELKEKKARVGAGSTDPARPRLAPTDEGRQGVRIHLGERLLGGEIPLEPSHGAGGRLDRALLPRVGALVGHPGVEDRSNGLVRPTPGCIPV
jgi:hypothetical protein